MKFKKRQINGQHNLTDLASGLKNYIRLNRTHLEILIRVNYLVPIKTMSQMDVQSSSPSTSKNSEFAKPEVPCSVINDVTKKPRQGSKRLNSADESIDDSESLSEAASSMSTQSKKRKGTQKTQTKSQTTSQRNSSIEAQNIKLTSEINSANNEITELKKKG